MGSGIANIKQRLIFSLGEFRSFQDSKKELEVKMPKKIQLNFLETASTGGNSFIGQWKCVSRLSANSTSTRC